ncbi:MAG TPA: hypothetical protein DDY37_01545 [Legionella sp.]|nr:hypothetical protein [Legionella sp.]
MYRLLMLLLGACLCLQAHAFPCFITVVKDNCWTDFDVKVTATNALNQKVLAVVRIPKGKSWARQELVCEPQQTIQFSAVFSPVFWESDTHKVFFSKRYWSLPGKIEEGIKAWGIDICFSDFFAEVPLPPEGSGHCACDMTAIPPIKSR